jgi:signal transduction histidine kinase/ActR/RegA family two-component response regulator
VATKAERDVSVFRLERGREALEKYAAFTHLTVQIHGPEGHVVARPVHGSPLFDLLAGGHDLGMFAACARQCLVRPEPGSPIVIDERHGLAVVGTPLVLAGEVVGAAVAGYALTTHPGPREITGLARECRLAFDEVWAVIRKELPVPRARLPLYGELLGVLGDTLLSENYRSRQLEETSMRLAQASEAKDRFLAVLSHELRTPLTAILGYARLLRGGRLEAGGKDRALEAIERNALLQTQLIEDLLDVSRIISGTLRIREAATALAPVLEVAAASVRPRADAKEISLHLVLAPDVTISGDAVRVQQIVSNLLVNAIKFTPAGGRVELRLERNGPEAQIVVKDSGAGIRRDFLPHVFERFRQDDTSEARSHGGLGLGLAIVRHLVELHGGSIRAESAGEGLGARFTVRLPALAGTAARLVAPEPPASGSSTAAELPALRGLRVLVVDDDVDARDLVTRVLEQHQARVRAVPSAEAALSALEDCAPDVLISDVGMPEESGYALIRRIRDLPPERGGTIRALALTAYAGAEDIKRAFSAGFQAHVAKPVEPAELALAVAGLVRGVDVS